MRAVACLAFASLVALASPAAAQAPVDKIKLEVTRAELQIIGQGLMELPYKTSAPVLNTITQQMAADQAAAKPEAKPAEASKAPAPKSSPALPSGR